MDIKKSIISINKIKAETSLKKRRKIIEKLTVTEI
jgi:hypothetical protein